VSQVQAAMAPKKAMLGPNTKDASQPGPKAQAAIRPAVAQIAKADKTINQIKAGPKGPMMAATRTQQVKLGPQELGAAKLPVQTGKPVSLSPQPKPQRLDVPKPGPQLQGAPKVGAPQGQMLAHKGGGGATKPNVLPRRLKPF
jgi:hypothetical protein